MFLYTDANLPLFNNASIFPNRAVTLTSDIKLKLEYTPLIQCCDNTIESLN